MKAKDKIRDAERAWKALGEKGNPPKFRKSAPIAPLPDRLMGVLMGSVLVGDFAGQEEVAQLAQDILAEVAHEFPLSIPERE